MTVIACMVMFAFFWCPGGYPALKLCPEQFVGFHITIIHSYQQSAAALMKQSQFQFVFSYKPIVLSHREACVCDRETIYPPPGVISAEL